MANRRRLIVLERRLEGALAAAAGHHPATCPYRDADAFQWARGFAGGWGSVEDCERALQTHRDKTQYYTNKFKEGL